MSTLPLAELEEVLHPVMSSPDQWQAIRYEIDINASTGLPESLVIGFLSQSGEQKRLRFERPKFHDFGSFRMPSAQHLYIADLSSLRWSSDQHIEVGEWEDERPTMFWASSVEPVA